MSEQAIIRADFLRPTGNRIKPMHGVGQPPFYGLKCTYFHYLEEAGIPYSRLHDVGGWFGGNMYVDVPNIFRNFDADVNEMTSALKVDKEKLEHHAVKSHGSRVSNIKALLNADISVNDFIASIEKYVLENMNAEMLDFGGNETVAALFNRNHSDEWIYSDKRYLTNYTVFRRKKYPFGIVKLEMKLDRDVIEDIVISGDFFGIESVEELENLIKGRRVGDLSGIRVSRYIHQMTSEELSSLMIGE